MSNKSWPGPNPNRNTIVEVNYAEPGLMVSLGGRTGKAGRIDSHDSTLVLWDDGERSKVPTWDLTWWTIPKKTSVFAVEQRKMRRPENRSPVDP